MKTKKYKEFINSKIDIKHEFKNESKNQNELKIAAETIGLDLTKNLPKKIDLI